MPVTVNVPVSVDEYCAADVPGFRAAVLLPTAILPMSATLEMMVGVAALAAVAASNELN